MTKQFKRKFSAPKSRGSKNQIQSGAERRIERIVGELKEINSKIVMCDKANDHIKRAIEHLETAVVDAWMYRNESNPNI